jgi:hypothetical protein
MPYAFDNSSPRATRGPDAIICGGARRFFANSPRIIASAIMPEPTKATREFCHMEDFTAEHAENA